MQRWEYLTIFISTVTWQNSLGRTGTLRNIYPRALESDRVGDPTELLNELGEQGWDLVGVNSGYTLTTYKLFLKRPRL
jgi:hypothetical protein